MFEKLKERIRFIKWVYANRNEKPAMAQLRTEQLPLSNVNVRFCLSRADIERCPEEFVKRQMTTLVGKAIIDRFPFYYLDQDNGCVFVCLDLLVTKQPGRGNDHGTEE